MAQHERRVRMRSPEEAPTERRHRGRPPLTEVQRQVNLPAKPKPHTPAPSHTNRPTMQQHTQHSPTECCARCTKRVLHVAHDKAVRCARCQRVYHKACYLADIGLAPSERVANLANSSCVVCLSGHFHPSWFLPEQELVGSVLTSLPRGWFRYRNRFQPAAWQAAHQLLTDGFVVVPLASGSETNVLDQLHGLRDAVSRQFQALQRSYERLVSHASVVGASVVSLSTGFQNFRMRCAGRYEVLTPCIGSVLTPLIHSSRLVQDVLQIVLHTESPHQMSDGCFFAQAGAGGQNLHTDGPMLAEEQQRRGGREGQTPNSGDSDTTELLPLQLFPYAVNCFVPLVDVTSSNGTEFYPRTQLLSATETPLPPKVAPSVPVGHVLLFDYRVRHRGLPNKCGSDRPCAYMTFSQPWYKDTYNFGSQRYTKALEVDDVFLETREQRHARRDHRRAGAEDTETLLSNQNPGRLEDPKSDPRSAR